MALFDISVRTSSTISFVWTELVVVVVLFLGLFVVFSSSCFASPRLSTEESKSFWKMPTKKAAVVHTSEIVHAIVAMFMTGQFHFVGGSVCHI